MQELLKIMRKLRSPVGGCPWDLKQSHESLRPYILEEAAEVVDAITDGNLDNLLEELGDVLLQIAFHAVIAESQNNFSYNDIEKTIVEKMIRRHPHVFANVEVDGAEEVAINWQEIKKAEKKGKAKSALESVPKSLATLMRAAELSKKLKWPTVSEADLIRQTAELTPSAQKIGELILAICSYSEDNGINPEIALREALSLRIKKM